MVLKNGVRRHRTDIWKQYPLLTELEATPLNLPGNCKFC